MALSIDRIELRPKVGYKAIIPHGNLQSLNEIFTATQPDELGFNGLTRDQQVEILSGPFLSVYRKIVLQYLGIKRGINELNPAKALRPIEARVPNEMGKTWGDVVSGWYSRTSDYLDGFAEEGHYLQHGHHNLAWIPLEGKGSDKIPLYFPKGGERSSLARASQFLFDIDTEYLRREEPTVRAWELEVCAAKGDWRMFRYLNRIMIVQGKTSGITYGDLFKSPF